MNLEIEEISMMKQVKKSEWFILDRPLAEPNESWIEGDAYHIERLVNNDGVTVWFGCSVNWKKELGGKWTVLTTNMDAKPLEEHLPDVVYGEDRMFWKETEIPIYEELYLKMRDNGDI